MKKFFHKSKIPILVLVFVGIAIGLIYLSVTLSSDTLYYDYDGAVLVDPYGSNEFGQYPPRYYTEGEMLIYTVFLVIILGMLFIALVWQRINSHRDKKKKLSQKKLKSIQKYIKYENSLT